MPTIMEFLAAQVFLFFFLGEKILKDIKLSSQNKYVHRPVDFMKHTSPEFTLLDHAICFTEKKRKFTSLK